jgi:hypothetical protein
MQRSSGDPPSARQRGAARGQVEPLAAIAAVLAIAAALALYAGVVTDLFGESESRETPKLILERSVEMATEVGVVEPNRLDRIHEALPDGWNATVTIRGTEYRFREGPAPPAIATETTQRVSVRLEPGRIAPGQFRVAVWR